MQGGASPTVQGGEAEEAGRSARHDGFAFELVSLVLALSGTPAGARQLTRMPAALVALLTLLQRGSARLQRQSLEVLRRRPV